MTAKTIAQLKAELAANRRELAALKANAKPEETAKQFCRRTFAAILTQP